MLPNDFYCLLMPFFILTPSLVALLSSPKIHSCRVEILNSGRNLEISFLFLGCGTHSRFPDFFSGKTLFFEKEVLAVTQWLREQSTPTRFKIIIFSRQGAQATPPNAGKKYWEKKTVVCGLCPARVTHSRVHTKTGYLTVGRKMPIKKTWSSFFGKVVLDFQEIHGYCLVTPTPRENHRTVFVPECVYR